MKNIFKLFSYKYNFLIIIATILTINIIGIGVAFANIEKSSQDQKVVGEKTEGQKFTPSQINSAKVLIEQICSKISAINLNQKLTQPKKIEQISNIINSNVDAEWIARFILGKNYRTMTEEQKVSFINTYQNFLINTYSPKMQKFSDNKFTILSAVDSGKFITVKTEFTLKDNTKPIVEFRVKSKNSANEKLQELVIIDFVTEGISFIETQRSEFGSAIAKDGVEKFLLNLIAKTKMLKIKETNNLEQSKAKN